MFIAYKTNEDTIRVSPGVKKCNKGKMMRLDQKGKLGIRLILKEVWKIIEHVISNLLEGCQVTVSAPFIMTKKRIYNSEH